MRKMKAVLFKSKDIPLTVSEVAKPTPGKNEVLIQLHYAALNHRDIWIWKEKVLDQEVIPGSDGSGVVVAVGEEADATLIGKEVVINPSMYWGNDSRFTGESYEILGNPANGTFAEYIKIDESFVYEKPAHLSLKEAAALPLAALTAYRALFTKAKITANDTVLVTGIGGGAALFLLQMAVAAGASVYVTSSSEKKINQAIQLGATGGFNYKDPEWTVKVKNTIGSFDVIVDSAGGDGFALLTEIAGQGARIVLFGRTAGDINHLKPSVIFNKQLSISGTMMGTHEEFKAMLSYYSEHNLKPVIDKTFQLNEINDAAAYMKSGEHFGKIIFSII
jgi:zinc-binding alcohol dehydrogenase/oxidoreductase